MTKRHFLGYAARYARRPPIAQRRFVKVTEREVEFLTKDKKLHQEVTTRYSVEQFAALLAEQVPDRYRHAICYFGLMAPGTKSRTWAALFVLLGQSSGHCCRGPSNDLSDRVLIIVVPHTFGAALNFNCHLHILVSADGLQESQGRIISRIHFAELPLMRLLPASACQKSRACLRPCAEMRWNPTDLEENDFCFSYALNHQVLRLPRPIGCAGISPLRAISRT